MGNGRRGAEVVRAELEKQGMDLALCHSLEGAEWHMGQ